MSQYDSAASVDEFLARMRRKPAKGKEALVQSTQAVEEDAVVESDQGLGNKDACPPEAVLTVRSPPLSPAYFPSTPTKEIDVYVAGASLSLEENDESRRQGAEDKDVASDLKSMDDWSQSTKNKLTPRQPSSGGRNMLDVELTGPEMTPTQIELLAEKNKRNIALMDDIVANSKAGAVSRFQDNMQISANDGAVCVPGNAGAFVLSPAAAAAAPVNQNLGNTTPLEAAATSCSADSSIVVHMPDDSAWTDKAIKDSGIATSSSAGTPPSSRGARKYKPVITVASPTLSSTPVTIHQSPPSSYHDNGALKRATDHLASKLADVQVETREQQDNVPNSTTALDGVDRQHAIFFGSWGTPELRSTSKSQVRRIILSGLPLNADYSFVASLIHGGAIESIYLNPAAKSAHVLFTEGGACHEYYEKYPNGIEVKHKGRNLMIFVDKGKEVDVISSMIQGYLGAGASRVVRASHVDEDWSMRALHRIAEGGKCQRKVESIVDSLRNETRTVIFRFANIADAVSFRHTLRRCDDWEAAEIGFVADPCEKSNTIHFD